MSQINGYVNVNSSKIHDACLKYLQDREERQERAKEAHIEYHMNKRWFPAKTVEAALECGSDIFGHAWAIGGLYWKLEVQALLRCSEVEDKVLVSIDVLEMLMPFMEKKDG